MAKARGGVAAVGFDLDYTLWNQDSFFATFFDGAAGAFGRRLGCGPRRFRQACAEALEQLTPAHPALFDRVLHQLGAWDPRLVGELVDRFHRHRPSAAPYPGVPRVLGQLREAGLRLFLVTDGHSPTQRHKVAALGLQDRFDALVFTGDLPAAQRKPSAAPFRLASERLGVPPARCLFVGDHPDGDFPGPKHLGMLTAQVDTGPFARRGTSPEAAPHLRLAALDDLVDLLVGVPARSDP